MNFSELINTRLVHAARHIREHTAIITANIPITNTESVFDVWVDFGFVELVDVLECWVRLQEGLCFDAEPKQNRSQCILQSIRIQQLTFYYFFRTIPWIRKERIAATWKVTIIDFIFRYQSYRKTIYSIQRLIKSAFDRIHQIVIECALCYSLTTALSCLYYSHTIVLIL